MNNSLQGKIDVINNRSNILYLICDGIHDKRELADTLPISRPTIDRAVRELEEHNLVKWSGGICEPTVSGKLALEIYEMAEETIKIVHNQGEVLNELPKNTNIPSLLLTGGSMHIPSDCAPYSPIEPVYTKLENEDALQILMPVILPHQLELIHRKSKITDANVEVIINSQILEVLLEQHPERTREMISKGNVLYKADELPNYSLFICDNNIIYITIYSPTNQPLGVIENTSSTALQWAQNQYALYRKNVTPLTC